MAPKWLKIGFFAFLSTAYHSEKSEKILVDQKQSNIQFSCVVSPVDIKKKKRKNEF